MNRTCRGAVAVLKRLRVVGSAVACSALWACSPPAMPMPDGGPDAGFDAGTADAGVDAGTPDAGLPCSATCAGCCETDGTCSAGTAAMACGMRAMACTACMQNQDCVGGVCMNRACLGCISAADQSCQPGTSDAGCGRGGVTCATCTGSTACDPRGTCSSCADACSGHGFPLRADCDSCTNTVCAADPFCCSAIWDQSCAVRARASCPGRCATPDSGVADAGTDAGTADAGSSDAGAGVDAGTPDAGCANVCSAQTFPMLDSCEPCTTTVCLRDPFCCTQRWDATCARAAAAGCPGRCSTDGGVDGGADAGRPDAGCPSVCSVSSSPIPTSCQPCVQSVCDTDPYCCTTAWDAPCVDRARAVCQGVCPVVDAGVDAGNPCRSVCFAQPAAIPSSCEPCASRVCDSDPFCCSDGWDTLCSLQARQGCPERCTRDAGTFNGGRCVGFGAVCSAAGQCCSGTCSGSTCTPPDAGPPVCALLDAGCTSNGQCCSDFCSGGACAINPSSMTTACGFSLCAPRDAGTVSSSSCDPCVQTLCKWDPYCCTTRWDSYCVRGAQEQCPGRCPCTPSSQTACPGGCTDVSVDKLNCGSCGAVCTPNSTCDAGACVCNAGQTLCPSDAGFPGFTCSRLRQDPKNCNACGVVCPDTCLNGVCAPCGTLPANSYLRANDFATSCDGRFRLVMQTDGNLVLYFGNAVLWAANTSNNIGAYMVMQADGNVAIYNMTNMAVFSSGTFNHPGAVLFIRNDGNMLVQTLHADGGSSIWWQTNTGGN